MALRCENCGARIDASSTRCSFCFEAQGQRAADAAPTRALALAGVARTRGEFGFASRGLALCLAIAVLLYAVGWRFENVRFLLATKAVAVWGGALPAWVFCAAVGWRARWGAWLVGLAIGVVTLVAHTALCFVLRGRVNDDVVGIAAAFSGAQVLGWALGRAFHEAVRRSRAKAL